MSRVVGIEIGDTRLRAVIRQGRRAPQTFELPFDPELLDAAVAELEALVGDVTQISLAIGLAHLHVKQVKLPPVARDARRQMLMVEPERWFAMAAGRDVAISLSDDGTLAHAADGQFVEASVRAFSRWAPVRRVEVAPEAVLRAFVLAGVHNACTTVDASAGEVGIVQLVKGALCSVRRIRGADADMDAMALTTLPDVAPAWIVAHGAALASDDEIATMLLTTGLERRFAGVQQRRLAGWSLAAIAAACTAVWSLGVSRDRMLDALDVEVSAARRESAAGQAAVQRAQTIDRELAAIATTTSGRTDALAALASLGAKLPVEAVAQRVRMVGNEWQVEGNAATASAVLAALAGEPRFDKVRFLAPSNRFRDGTEDRETFAIAFAVR